MGIRELQIIIPFAAVVILMYSAEWLVQRSANQRAPSLLNDDKQNNLILYLRSFDRSMIALQVRRAIRYTVELISVFFPIGPPVEHFSYDIERNIADIASSADANLIAIGDKYFTMGATKIRTHDHSWRKLFDGISDRCLIIVCELHSSPSCLWEINRIASTVDLLNKTVFVLPPGHIAVSYQQIAVTATTLGLQLPEYSFNGWVYIAAPEPQLHSFRQLGGVIAELISVQAPRIVER